MINNITFAEAATAQLGKGITYAQMDCQAFVEYVLKLCGVARNWKGSNDMWRNALSWKGTPEECIAKYGAIPRGAWLFTLKFDGGEKERGYNDSEGNAAHVGIYTGTGAGAVHSTTGGVQAADYPGSRWNRVGLASDINYSVATDDAEKLVRARAGLTAIKECVEELLNEL